MTTMDGHKFKNLINNKMIQNKTRILRTVIDRNGPFLLTNKTQEA